MEKINIAEILKDYPKGTELYSPICGNCKLLKIYTGLGFDVINETGDVFNFLYDGRYALNGECLIFPSKDQRDWSKFKIEITMQTESQDTSSITKEKMPYRANLRISGYTELEIPESFDINIKGNIVCLTPKTLEKLKKEKFDISTLKPFDKVLVRIFHKEEWKADFFSHYTNDADHPFITVGKHALCYCIPYENNEHLLGKTDDCDEFYKTWE